MQVIMSSFYSLQLLLKVSNSVLPEHEIGPRNRPIRGPPVLFMEPVGTSMPFQRNEDWISLSLIL